MVASEISGKVQTVLGTIAPEDLGVTLIHEHLLFDFSSLFVESAEATGKRLAHQPMALMTLQDAGWLRMNFEMNLDNACLFDEEVAIDEVLLYKRNGGRTITDVTPKGVGRDPLGLARIARHTGLNIIMGTAYYMTGTHPREMEDWIKQATEQQIAADFINEIMVGAEGTQVRAGIIGEVASSWPLSKNEVKVLRASAIAQQDTGAPLMIHPGANENAPLEIIKILRDAGADLSRTIICHMPRTLFNLADRLKVAEAGCYLEWDSFGRDSYHNPGFHFAPLILPSDPEQINQICELIAEGYEKQILISQDVCFSHWLTRYGGHGYGYILRYGVPLMRRKGMTDEQIHTLLIENPKNILQFAPKNSLRK